MKEETIQEQDNPEEMAAENAADDTDRADTSASENQSGTSPVEELVAAGSHEVMEALKGELEAWQSRANEYLDGWQRSRAEFANYKKRQEREQSLLYQNAAGTIIKRYLEVLDDLDRALKNRPQDGDGAAWAAGIELIYRKLSSILESEGVVVMQAEGQSFDPNLHEAISQEDNHQYESGQIIEVIKQGYLIGDRVLRPALVRIAR
ncbi:MAG: nucleotide exchange factor GrpE [Chloroflexi bacterium RBG_16_52_11]|nr:MAG: nucleotide exchange factor GrpE [Chloroflexi bacterium RBG_16_52_11]